MTYRLPLLSWIAVFSLLLLSVLVVGDADFQSVRVSLQKDHSGKEGDPKEKFFREYREFVLCMCPGH